jgi:hypothetical protein
MSQPEHYMNNPESEIYSYSQNPYGMSEEEKESKRTQFQQFFISLEKNLQNEDAVELDVPTLNDKHFYYFIGRLNPPHDGHILALETLVKKAQETHSIPLILLGSGPGKKQTMDNPIAFDLKKKFIEKKLLERGIAPSSYEIKEMTNPATQVSEYIGTGLDSDINYDNINITHVAGGKDEDTTKLAFALNSGENKAKMMAPGSNIEATTFAVEPKQNVTGEKAMSATEVRRSVYKNYISGKTFLDWDPRYKDFYGDMSEDIYNAILDPAKQLSQENVQNYVDTGSLPKTSSNSNSNSNSKKRKISGGKKSKKSKKSKTHGKRNKKNINKRISKKYIKIK